MNRLLILFIYLFTILPTWANNTDSLIAVQFRTLALEALDNEKKDSANYYLEQALSAYQKSNDLVNWINTHKDFGKRFRDQLKDPTTALLYLNATTENKLWRSPQNETEWDALGWLYVNLAYTYNYSFEDYKLARLNYQKAIDILVIRLNIEDFYVAKYIYQPLGNINTRLGDHQAAEILIKKFIKICTKLEQHQLLAGAYSDLGILYTGTENLEKAIKSFQQGLSLPQLSPYYNGLLEVNLTKVFFQLRKNKEALQHVQSSKAAFQEAILDQNTLEAEWALFRLPHTMMYSGEIFCALGEFQKAEEQLQNAHDLFIEIDQFGISRDFGKLNIAFGVLYSDWGKFDLSVSHYQQALQNVLEGFKPQNDLDNPNSSLFFAENTILEALVGKADALTNRYKNSQKIKDLEVALECYQLMYEVEKLIRRSHHYESSKLFSLEESNDQSERAIQLAQQLWELTQNPIYKYKAFEFAEKSKSILLLEAFRKTDAETVAGIPTEMLATEKQLQTDIAIAEEDLFNARSDQATDTLIQQMEEELLHLRQSYTSWIHELETKHQQYYNLKYNFSAPSLKALRKTMGQKEALIEYFVGQKQVYIFLLTQNQFELLTVNKDFPLEDWVVQFRQDIEQFQFANADRMNLCNAYTDMAYQLYQKLILPLEKYNLPQQLTIIPNSVLGYLPFDALLNEQPAQRCQFKNYPYLIHQYTISYGYSATLQETLHQMPKSKPNFAGFAPAFDGNGGFGPLEKNIPSIQQTNSILKGRLFLDRDATTAQFKAYAGDYGIIQLATHAQANTQDGNFSFIAFSDGQGNYDSLFVKDLYLMELQAELVVLSACETAVGTIHKGEGIISLARGFFYSGAKSMVTTLWSINESTNLQIVEAFYKSLRKGLTKSEALRKSKIDQIGATDQFHAHPVYWAALTPIGNQKAIFSSARILYLSLGAMILLLGGGLIWFFQKRGVIKAIIPSKKVRQQVRA